MFKFHRIHTIRMNENWLGIGEKVNPKVMNENLMCIGEKVNPKVYFSFGMNTGKIIE